MTKRGTTVRAEMEVNMAGKFNVAEAAKVAALCLPPVILSLIGLAAMGRKPKSQALAAKAAAKLSRRRPT